MHLKKCNITFFVCWWCKNSLCYDQTYNKIICRIVYIWQGGSVYRPFVLVVDSTAIRRLRRFFVVVLLGSIVLTLWLPRLTNSNPRPTNTIHYQGKKSWEFLIIITGKCFDLSSNSLINHNYNKILKSDWIWAVLISALILDWLGAVVFQLNLKYLHVKITNLLRVVV